MEIPQIVIGERVVTDNDSKINLLSLFYNSLSEEYNLKSKIHLSQITISLLLSGNPLYFQF